MFYKTTEAKVLKEGVWDEKSCIRRVGGYDIDKTSLPADMEWLPKGAVLAFNSSNQKAVLVKTAEAYEQATGTSIKIKKGHCLTVGDTVAGSTISKITEGTDFDTLTVSTLSETIEEGAIIASDFDIILGLNYASVKIDDNPTCTPTLQAYEIQEETLPYPINDAIKKALTCRHAFKI